MCIKLTQNQQILSRLLKASEASDEISAYVGKLICCAYVGKRICLLLLETNVCVFITNTKINSQLIRFVSFFAATPMQKRSF